MAYDPIEQAKLIYEAQPTAYNASAYQVAMQLAALKVEVEQNLKAAKEDRDSAKVEFAFAARMADKRRWQPIETAPRDGSLMLGFMDYEKEEGDDYEFYSVIRWESGHGWVQETVYMDYFRATHWMPLPEPPEPSEEPAEDAK